MDNWLAKLASEQTVEDVNFEQALDELSPEDLQAFAEEEVSTPNLDNIQEKIAEADGMGRELAREKGPGLAAQAEDRALQNHAAMHAIQDMPDDDAVKLAFVMENGSEEQVKEAFAGLAAKGLKAVKGLVGSGGAQKMVGGVGRFAKKNPNATLAIAGGTAGGVGSKATGGSFTGGALGGAAAGFGAGKLTGVTGKQMSKGIGKTYGKAMNWAKTASLQDAVGAMAEHDMAKVAKGAYARTLRDHAGKLGLAAGGGAAVGGGLGYQAGKGRSPGSIITEVDAEGNPLGSALLDRKGRGGFKDLKKLTIDPSGYVTKTANWKRKALKGAAGLGAAGAVGGAGAAVGHKKGKQKGYRTGASAGYRYGVGRGYQAGARRGYLAGIQRNLQSSSSKSGKSAKKEKKAELEKEAISSRKIRNAAFKAGFFGKGTDRAVKAARTGAARDSNLYSRIKSDRVPTSETINGRLSKEVGLGGAFRRGQKARKAAPYAAAGLGAAGLGAVASKKSKDKKVKQAYVQAISPFI